MTDSTLTLHLTGKEAEYFSKLTSEDDSLAVLLSSHPEIIVNRRTVTLTRTASEMLRDYFTERLARVGFDTDYKPNEPELGKLMDRRGVSQFSHFKPFDLIFQKTRTEGWLAQGDDFRTFLDALVVSSISLESQSTLDRVRAL